MTIPTLPIELDDLGLIGTRSLRALQLVRIGRHASTAMLIPRDGIWVVSGRGPETGSNGAGKTVLLGAMSLLNGDPQWNGDNGIGPNAARLLFDHNRARVGNVRYADAAHGYIAGVYLYPDRLHDAITVWMRIERHSNTYVQVRWGTGIRLVDGVSEEARFGRANDEWSNLRDNEPIKVTKYAAALFGKAPRCIAYIRARGSEENQDRGLLALGQRPFRPTDLASQIITLAGKSQAVDNERQFRQELDATESLLTSKKAAFDLQYLREERQLRDIADRTRSRSLLHDAADAWQLYLTLAVLLVRNRANDLASDLTRLEAVAEEKSLEILAAQKAKALLPSRDMLARAADRARKASQDATAAKDRLVAESGGNTRRQSDCAKNLSKLRVQAALAPGLSAPDAEVALGDARNRLREADQEVDRSDALVKATAAHLQRLRLGRGGPAGPALEVLDAERIGAIALLDLVALDDEMRAQWEARLSPYANTVVVARSDVDRARQTLSAYPGVPVASFTDDVPTSAAFVPGADGILAGFFRELEARMPVAGTVWVTDTVLGLHIPGGYEIPLTDRAAAIRAAEDEFERVNGLWAAAQELEGRAGAAVTRAENNLVSAKAQTELVEVQSEVEQLKARAHELLGLVQGARDAEVEAGDLFRTAETGYLGVEEQRNALDAQIRELTSGDTGRGVLLERIAAVREEGRLEKAAVNRWQHVADILNLDAAESTIAQADITLDVLTRDTYYAKARSSLRQAIEAVLGSAKDDTTANDTTTVLGFSGGEELHIQLNAGIHDLHQWCDRPRAMHDDAARSFDLVAMPLRSWLDWHGADDETTEAQIHTQRAADKREIEAVEQQTAETRMWINSQRDNQIAIISQAFKDIEKKLNELLTSVRQDPIALRPTYSDLNDPSQPLRWELHPQWLPAGAKPVDYSNPPNTAELIILHVLLATASLVAASTAQGRMLILDESGNNLDGPNLTKVSAVLRHVADTYHLTVVLACQDVYTDRVARHGAAMIQLLRPSPLDPLNAPPDVSHAHEDPTVLEALLPYLNLGRPDR